MTRSTLEGIPVTQINRMLENTIRRFDQLAGKRLIDGCVADGAIVSDHFALAASVLTVVTTETSLSVVMPDIIDM